jgi:hypothetical protein
MECWGSVLNSDLAWWLEQAIKMWIVGEFVDIVWTLRDMAAKG